MKKRMLALSFTIAVIGANNVLANDYPVSPSYLAHPTGVYVDISEIPALKEAEAREYAKYKRNKEARRNSAAKPATGDVNIWGQWMSSVEDQYPYSNCYAHAATGVVEGLLHEYDNLNSDIDLDEYEIASGIYPNCPGHDIGLGSTFYCTIDGGHPECAFNYIKNVRAICEVDHEFPNYELAFSSLVSFTELSLSRVDMESNIETVQTALAISPVSTIFEVRTSYFGGGWDIDGVLRSSYGNLARIIHKPADAIP